jgi:Ca2+-dependent lipid-binding protein
MGDNNDIEDAMRMLDDNSSMASTTTTTANGHVSSSIRLQVLRAKGLPKPAPSVNAKEDPWVVARIFWNREPAGQTRIASLRDPRWENERFVLPMPENLDQAQLRVELHGMNRQGIASFLGQVVLESDELMLLEPPFNAAEFSLVARERGTASAVVGDLVLQVSVVDGFHLQFG